ncbi:hypothetical protein FQZ97_893970 [compost metagenome]
MGLAVESIHHQVAAVVQFIGQPLDHYPADHGWAAATGLEDRQLPLRATHCALKCAHDIAALAHGAQGRLGVVADDPLPWLILASQAKPLQVL